MKRMCAWCGLELSPKPGENAQISHGICEACADEVISNTPIPLQRYLDRMPEPVVVVDGDVTVLLMNRSAQALTGQAPQAGARLKGGDVFDCAHAKLPGGCGRTIHCSGCVLRRSVTATHETGEPQVRVPATLKKGDPDRYDSAVLTITTIKRGDAVLLRIDKLE